MVYFKLQLVMFFEGIRSERQLIETASLNLVHRWYLGHALDEKLPDHSSLTRIRQRLGVDIFQRFFEKIVDLCQEAGLIWGRELFVDATKVAANADVDSLIPRFAYNAKAHVADLFENETGDAAPQADTDLPPDIVRLPIDPQRIPPESDPPWRLLEERRLDPHRPAVGTYRRTTDFRVSVTDPDATGIRAFFPLPDFDQRTPFYGKSRFIYDAGGDVYHCPRGQPLPRRKAKYTEQEMVYRSDAQAAGLGRAAVR